MQKLGGQSAHLLATSQGSMPRNVNVATSFFLAGGSLNLIYMTNAIKRADQRRGKQSAVYSTLSYTSLHTKRSAFISLLKSDVGTRSVCVSHFNILTCHIFLPYGLHECDNKVDFHRSKIKTAFHVHLHRIPRGKQIKIRNAAYFALISCNNQMHLL